MLAFANLHGLVPVAAKEVERCLCMARKLGWIRQFHKPVAPQSLPLLVFPHAGAGASAYRDFSKSLSTTFDVIVSTDCVCSALR